MSHWNTTQADPLKAGDVLTLMENEGYQIISIFPQEDKVTIIGRLGGPQASQQNNFSERIEQVEKKLATMAECPADALPETFYSRQQVDEILSQNQRIYDEGYEEAAETIAELRHMNRLGSDECKILMKARNLLHETAATQPYSESSQYLQTAKELRDILDSLQV